MSSEMTPPVAARVTTASTRACIAGVVLRSLALLLVLNLLFLGIRLADNLVPKAEVESELRTGFANGSISTESYSENMLIGRDQYSDCITAQLAVLGGADTLHDAIAPRLLHLEQVGPDLRPTKFESCLELKRYLAGQDRHTPQATYTRFWQGGASALAFALTFLPVDGYRSLLLNLSLGLIALTAVLAARASPRLLKALAPLLIISFLFGGQIGYGQLFSYGPPQIIGWSFAVGMIAFRGRLTFERLIPLAVAAGAFEAFCDQIISVPLMAGVFAIVAGFVLQIRGDSSSARSAAGSIAVLFSAWMAGFAGSYILKLLISVALLGWDPIRDFMTQLLFRAGTIDAKFGFGPERHTSRFAMAGTNFIALMGNSWRLGYTSGNSGITGCLIVVVVMMTGWAAAIHTFAILPRAERGRFAAAGAPYLGAAIFLLLWVIVFPEHTIRHAFFMVRSATLWMIGGWGWVFAAHRSDRSQQAVEAGKA